MSPVAKASRAPSVVEIKAAYKKCTDLGNSERLAKRCKGRLLHVRGLGWLRWDGKRWDRCTRGEEIEAAKAMVRSIYGEASELSGTAAQLASDDGARSQVADLAAVHGRWAARSEAGPRIRSAVDLARSDPRLTADVSDLDTDPDVLNVENGTLDLDSFELRPHEPADRLTKLAGASFDPDARAPFWEKTLELVLPDAEVRRFVQMAAGYSMLGRYSQYLFIPWGGGANGKSTFLWGLRHVLGDYAQEAPPDLLVSRKERSAGNDSALAATRGQRVVTTIETEQGHRLAEVQVKQLTGEAQITAKFMRQDHFTFENQAAVWLATNHRPVVQGMDHAMWRRIRLIPFEVRIPDAAQIDHSEVEATLHRERDGILVWLTEGLRLYRMHGLKNAPEAVALATGKYREEMDPLAEWIDDRCALDDRDALTPYSELWNAYRIHCAFTGRKELGATRFRELLDNMGVENAGRVMIDGKQQRARRGIRLV